MAQGSVRQRGTTWTVVFDEPRADGRRRQRSKGGFRTRKEAERYLREHLVSLDVSLDAGTYIAPHKLTMATYLAEHWLPAMHARGLRRRWHGTKAMSDAPSAHHWAACRFRRLGRRTSTTCIATCGPRDGAQDHPQCPWGAEQGPG
jgi:hypothetical protein